MKKNIITLAFCTAALLNISLVKAQKSVPTHDEVVNTFKTKGYFDAKELINEGLKKDPNNYQLLHDKVVMGFGQSQWPDVILAGDKLIKDGKADESEFLMTGLAYKNQGNPNEATLVYKTGLEKFPSSGLLLNDYGEGLYAQGKSNDALEIFEKGVASDPNVSGNYYYLSKIYSQKNNPLWAALYGEIFVNLESLTSRTNDIKDIVLQNTRKLFAKKGAKQYINSANPFEASVATTIDALNNNVAPDASAEALTAARAQFIVTWFTGADATKFPYRLFDRERQLLKQGDFDAYNQWLFSGANYASFNIWIHQNEEFYNSYKQYQRNVIFKLSPDQNYKK